MQQQIDINEVQKMLSERDMQILLLRSENASLRQQLEVKEKASLASEAQGKQKQ
jgi:hypothetical protein